MAVAELLDPQPGERILDLAAAPGGKATHIAALMAGQGLLMANESHPKRAWDLAENLERWGATNAAITNESPERLAEHFEGFFDRVLLDAPCSGEGMFRKSAAARREWSPALVNGCALRQSAILRSAARLVRPGGRLVYSTCTFAPEEDEGVVARFLSEHADFDAIEPPRCSGFSPGRPDWLRRDVREACDVSANVSTRAVRLWPHTGPGEGHFIAVLQRKSALDPAPSLKAWGVSSLPRPAERAYREFCRANLVAMPATDRLALVGSYLYALPPDLPELSGLRFLHAGWWLGTLRKDRFEPSHALALGLKRRDVPAERLYIRVASLSADDPDLRTFLGGGGFNSPGEDGWILVAVDGHPVGWGKRVAGTVKSHYPKGLRRA